MFLGEVEQAIAGLLQAALGDGDHDAVRGGDDRFQLSQGIMQRGDMSEEIAFADSVAEHG
jgi:hypothetical protein